MKIAKTARTSQAIKRLITHERTNSFLLILRSTKRSNGVSVSDALKNFEILRFIIENF